jgi:predicted dehydrogenase
LLLGPSRTPTESKEGEHRDCFGAEIDDFCAAVREGREPAVSSMDGLNVMRVVLGAYESARSGAAVRLASA